MNNLSIKNSIIISSITLTIIIIALLFTQSIKHKPKVVEEATNYIVPTTSTDTHSLYVTAINPNNKATDIATTSKITITFNRTVKANELTIDTTPHFKYSITSNGKSLTLTPTTSLLSGTEYVLVIHSVNVDIPTYPYSFTTAGKVTVTQEPYPPAGYFELRDDQLKTDRPDIYLTNQLPFSNQFFSVSYVFSQTPTSHYAFTVTVRGTSDQSKQEFTKWLQSIGLTDQQISSLDITYK